MTDQPKTVFITKYALTDKITEHELRKVFEDGSYVEVAWKGAASWNNTQLFFGKDWHYSAADALARAEVMRKAKIAGHERSIAKLRAMTFDLPDTPTQEGE